MEPQPLVQRQAPLLGVAPRRRAIVRAEVRWPAAFVVATLSFALRVPFFGSPILSDEAGYAYVAHVWRGGAVLYRDVFIDRPQGLLLLYRLVESVFGVDPVAIRAMGASAGFLVVLATFAFARRVLGPRPALAAAAVVGFITSAPILGGFAANGEILAAAPAIAAIVVALRACSEPQRRRQLALLAVSGALGACAVLIKQSAFDGLIVAAAIVAWPRLRPSQSGGQTGAGTRTRYDVMALVAGAAAPLVVALAHAWATCGLAAYWNAQVAFRLGLAAADGHGLEDRLSRLGRSWLEVLPVLLPLVPFAVVGAVRAGRWGAGGATVRVWAVACLAGFGLGEAYWTHYYLQLVAPLSVLCVMGVMSLRRPRLSGGAMAAIASTCAVAPFAVSIIVAPMLAATPADRFARAGISERFGTATAVGHYLKAHAEPSDTVYVLYEGPAVPLFAGIDSAEPYVWWPQNYVIPRLERDVPVLLARPHPPEWIAQLDDVSLQSIGPALAPLVARRYRLVTTIGSASVLRWNGT